MSKMIREELREIMSKICETGVHSSELVIRMFDLAQSDGQCSIDIVHLELWNEEKEK